MRLPISVLDLAPIGRGQTPTDSIAASVALAQAAEQHGYRRVWYAEHHNMPSIASSATAVLIAHVAAHTRSIRLGSGGIMLPNHSPLVIAEQFGTLATLHPGRIDLGLGRAPGTDPATMRALRRNHVSAEAFPRDVLELLRYFEPDDGEFAIRAVPGAGLRVPVWLLGSSLFSAQLAAKLGLPFAFAAHFAPDLLLEALDVYRSRFEPSAFRAEPHAMVCTNVYAAESDAEAERLFTSLEQAFLALRSGRPGLLPPPIDRSRELDLAREASAQLFRYSIVGGRETVRRGIVDFLRLTAADELMATAMIFDHAARLRSFEILAEVRDSLVKSDESPPDAVQILGV